MWRTKIVFAIALSGIPFIKESRVFACWHDGRGMEGRVRSTVANVIVLANSKSPIAWEHHATGSWGFEQKPVGVESPTGHL